MSFYLAGVMCSGMLLHGAAGCYVMLWVLRGAAWWCVVLRSAAWWWVVVRGAAWCCVMYVMRRTMGYALCTSSV